MTVIYALWLRELRRYVRSRAQVITSMAQPLLYLLALGFGMGPVFQKAGMGNYRQFVTPGIIGMTILYSSIFSGAGLIFDRQFGFLKETLVAPVPRLYIMLGRTLGAATVAVLQGLLVAIACLLCGFRPVHLIDVPLALVFMAIIASLFSGLGTAIGSTLQNIQGFQMIMGFLVMPLFFLSGALYPLNNLPAALNVIVTLDPLAYGVDGLRSLLVGGSHFGLLTDAAVLLATASAVLVFGSRMFAKIQV